MFVVVIVVVVAAAAVVLVVMDLNRIVGIAVCLCLVGSELKPEWRKSRPKWLKGPPSLLCNAK